MLSSVPHHFIASCYQVTMTMWGDKAKEDEGQWAAMPVLGVKKCKVSDYNGVSLSSLGSSQLVLNPPVAETAALQAWWAATGFSIASPKSLSKGGGGGGGGMRDTSLGQRKALAAIKEENMGLGEKGDYITTKATVDHILRKEGSEGPW
jgi:replication factor A1